MVHACSTDAAVSVTWYCLRLQFASRREQSEFRFLCLSLIVVNREFAALSAKKEKEKKGSLLKPIDYRLDWM